MKAIERRPSYEQQVRSNGKLLFLQGSAGTGETFTLKILWYVAQSRVHVVEIAGKSAIAAALYKGGRTVHGFLGPVADDRDSTDGFSARSSMYVPLTERGKLLLRAYLLIIYDASMIERRSSS